MMNMSRNDELRDMKCPNCGGTFEVELMENRAVCPYCDSEFEIVTDDDAKVELIKLKAYMENEEKNREIEEKRASEGRAQAFKGSRLGKAMLVLAVITGFIGIEAFISLRIIKGIIALIQCVCFISVYVIGTERAKERFKHQYVICLVAGIVLFAPLVSIGGGSVNNYEKLDWNSLALSSLLPEPDSSKGKVIVDSEGSLDITIAKTEKDDFRKYVEACKDMGYTNEAKNTDDSYEAFGKDGYQLQVNYRDLDKEMDIELDAPRKMGEIKWPEDGAGALLPVPKSLLGDIYEDSTLSFGAYIGEMDKDAFDSYIDRCKEKGFTVDYDRNENYFNAKDKDGAELDVTYKGNNVISIYIDVPEKKEEPKEKKKDKSKAKEKKKAKKEKSKSKGKVSSSFKKSMDEYEKFFDEYVEFMNSYDESDVSKLAKYTSMVSEYYKTMEALEDIDEDELSDADYAYYIEVLARINEKLSEVE